MEDDPRDADYDKTFANNLELFYLSKYEKDVHLYFPKEKESDEVEINKYLQHANKSRRRISNMYIVYFIYNKLFATHVSLRVLKLFTEHNFVDVKYVYDNSILKQIFDVLNDSASISASVRESVFKKFLVNSNVNQVKYFMYDNNLKDSDKSSLPTYIEKFYSAKNSPIVLKYNYKNYNMHSMYLQFENDKNFFNLDHIYELLKKQINYVAKLDKKILDNIMHHQDGWSDPSYDTVELKRNLKHIFDNIPPLEHDIIVFRGTQNQNSFNTNKYVSTTISVGVALSFIKDYCCLYVIQVPRGSKILPFFFKNDFLHEAEILLNENSTFTLEKEKHLYCEEVYINDNDTYKGMPNSNIYMVNTCIAKYHHK